MFRFKQLLDTHASQLAASAIFTRDGDTAREFVGRVQPAWWA